MPTSFDAPAKVFGERHGGRYHMPLLPGESGTKAGGDYVPGGVMSATNLAGAIADSRELQVWLVQRALMGVAVAPELYEQVVLAVDTARLNGVDLRKLRETDAGRELVIELGRIDNAAREAVGANRAATMGTLRHAAWETRGKGGALIGTPAMRAQTLAVEELLEREGLERVPGLSERVVRNTTLDAAGRFDDVLRVKRTGRMFMADLKTKQRGFFSWLEVWIQLTTYATADWMLDFTEGARYVPGPRHNVDQDVAIIVHAPSDGAPPKLEPVDLHAGMRWAQLARDVTRARAEARSVRTVAHPKWREETLAPDSGAQ